MAYVVPNSEIRLLSNVPVDVTYRHTLWFDSAASQENYFISKTKRYFDKCTYSRVTPAYIKLQVPADAIRDCNYLMYKNTAYTDKWFYAFITSVKYISNTVCGITFVLDQLQTWFFQMELAQCFIERQHSTTDSEGDNLIPENLETGEYMYVDNNLDWSKTFTGYDVVVFSTFASSVTATGTWIFTSTQGSYRWGIYSGLNMRVFRHIEEDATATSINNFLSAVVDEYGEQNGIVAMVMIPSDSLDDQLLPTQLSHTVPKITALDGYVPVNKKLLTYPYCYIELQNCEGAVGTLRQEYFGGTNPAVCQFMITFNITTAPVAFCVPINYMGSEYNYSQGMFINNFSQCSYNTDLFQAYMAQSLAGSTIKSAVDTVSVGTATLANDVNWVADTMAKQLGLKKGEVQPYTPINNYDYELNRDWVRRNATSLTGSIMAGAGLVISDAGDAVDASTAGINASIMSAYNSVYSIMQGIYSHAVAAPHNNGANTPDYYTSNRLKGFWLFHRTITNEFARKIDAYFSRFGYAQHTIATPNLHARERFTYIKTVDCVVHGAIPADAASTIEAILDGGTTFWADHNNVGNYTLNNAIV